MEYIVITLSACVDITSGAIRDHMSTSALRRAIKEAGSQAILGGLVGVTQTAVSNWLHRSKRVPAEYVLAIEASTGVSRHDLRPDLYPREPRVSPVIQQVA